MQTDWGRKYWDWLAEYALPLWATTGVDAEGGFEELLGSDGRPAKAPRRSRVQARQSFVFAHAGRLGWKGPWEQIAPVGLDWLDRHCRREDGLYSTLSAPGGAVMDAAAMTYDQAFVLLAMSELHRHGARGRWEQKALGLLDRVQILRRHPAGGFVEQDGRFLSNPHMHLLEACLAWVEADGAPVWRDVAGEIVNLALDRFIDPGKKVLREIFDSEWHPAPGGDGETVEPGHQFEWAWLLERWARQTRNVRAHDAAVALFAAGLRGVDVHHGAVTDETDTDFAPRRATARLWPQTEWLKAACILNDTVQRDAAAAMLWRYLETPKAGLWRDKMREDGSFVAEPAPASSLYHIICAVAALKEAA
ncbi:MAG TPA: AGE family epimerase/isomerase [Rhizomicrobium sp.]|nr:AGE family epimerase/isomerase [Rhizomicrobium sp.]